MKVGQKVKVLNCIDRVNNSTAAKVGQLGVVQGEKILDGGKIGYMVNFSDNLATWFFGEELEAVI